MKLYRKKDIIFKKIVTNWWGLIFKSLVHCLYAQQVRDQGTGELVPGGGEQVSHRLGQGRIMLLHLGLVQVMLVNLEFMAILSAKVGMKSLVWIEMVKLGGE